MGVGVGGGEGGPDGSRRSYKVEAVPEDGWYIVKVPEVDGALTQARNYTEIEVMARDVVALILDVPLDSFDLVLPLPPSGGGGGGGSGA